MTKTILFLLLLATTNLGYGQTPRDEPGFAKEDFMKKSSKQKTLAWIFGGTGLGLFTVGAIMYMSEFGNGLPGGTGYNDKTSRTGKTLMYAGSGLILVSVPLQIAYKRNQRLAASLSLENRRILYPQKGGMRSVSFLSMKINLGRQH